MVFYCSAGCHFGGDTVPPTGGESPLVSITFCSGCIVDVEPKYIFVKHKDSLYDSFLDEGGETPPPAAGIQSDQEAKQSLQHRL